jgi:hypothetical protein
VRMFLRRSSGELVTLGARSPRETG